MKAAVAAGLAALLLLAACREAVPVRPPDGPKPELFLLTPLPIVWSESFGLDQIGSPVLAALERDYRVTPIDLPGEVPDGALLLAAQPRALPAEELVALDAWVRRGGRLLLLVDPLLEWPSGLPVGDPRRAPVTFADTGLLKHWGLRLDVPDERGPRQQSLGTGWILTASPGRLVSVGPPPVVVKLVGRAALSAPPGQQTTLKRGCVINDSGLTAHCRIGKGEAVIIADADFLNLGSGGLDGPTDRNLPALVSQLADLSR